MALQITCACGQVLRLRDEYAGRTMRCPACGRVVDVPTADAPPTPPRHPAPESRPRPAPPRRRPLDEEDEAPVQRRRAGTSALAIISLLLGVLSWLPIGALPLLMKGQRAEQFRMALWVGGPQILVAILAILLGSLALKEIDQSQGQLQGRGMAAVGVLFPALATLVLPFLIVIVVSA